MTLAFSRNANIVYDEPEKYSLSNLKDAFMYLRENRETIGLTGYSINVMNNNLEIYVPEWSDEKEEEITNAINIDNINFIEDYGVVDETDEMIRIDGDIEEDPEEKAITWARCGYGIEDANIIDPESNQNLKATIGAITTLNGNTVFVSTAHGGVKKGDRIYLHDVDSSGVSQRGYLGTVLDAYIGETGGKKGNSIDACVISYDKSSSIVPVSEDRESNDILGKGAIGSGNDVIIRGAVSNKVPAYVVDAYATDVSWNGEWFQNMFRMEYTSSKQTTKGDSGAPILTDDNYLVGIYKGRKEVPGGYEAYGCKWVFVEDWFGLDEMDYN